MYKWSKSCMYIDMVYNHTLAMWIGLDTTLRSTGKLEGLSFADFFAATARRNPAARGGLSNVADSATYG